MRRLRRSSSCRVRNVIGLEEKDMPIELRLGFAEKSFKAQGNAYFATRCCKGESKSTILFTCFLFAKGCKCLKSAFTL